MVFAFPPLLLIVGMFCVSPFLGACYHSQKDASITAMGTDILVGFYGVLAAVGVSWDVGDSLSIPSFLQRHLQSWPQGAVVGEGATMAALCPVRILGRFSG